MLPPISLRGILEVFDIRAMLEVQDHPIGLIEAPRAEVQGPGFWGFGYRHKFMTLTPWNQGGT